MKLKYEDYEVKIRRPCWVTLTYANDLHQNDHFKNKATAVDFTAQ